MEGNIKSLFKDIEENNPEKAITNVKNTVELLKTTYVETADREFFAEFYMEIGGHLNYDFSGKLNAFLYKDSRMAEFLKKELPWE